ncbi:SRPBCC family protein [Pelagicoccus sp. SDUM812003]|uniref:SRPBCC family protein n=1 Tax=Pelagicoccus sp. SDUM812003 TaxID=3041267 RepID=UPI00280F54F2|nr:SRPBCC family protein [Pelagicoccus sp. SDUM812003]MDQ8205141.1 SRPBCC family protein [Pelagicoccus sp. SDUM812003]
MRKFLIGLIAAFAVLFLLTVAIGLFLPGDFTVRRSIEVQAPAERLYELVGDLERWPDWGPWKEADPTLVIELGEKTSGVGASQTWHGKDGNARLEFIEADPASGVTFDLYFNDDAFYNLSSIRYAPLPGGQGYEVVWEMSGVVEVPVLGGYLALAMDDMVGAMFEDGLEKLKRVAEDPTVEAKTQL